MQHSILCDPPLLSPRTQKNHGILTWVQLKFQHRLKKRKTVNVKKKKKTPTFIHLFSPQANDVPGTISADGADYGWEPERGGLGANNGAQGSPAGNYI